MNQYAVRLFVFVSFLFVFQSYAQTENQWLCGACRIMNHEIAQEISRTDDSKTTLGGSYRIDPNGNQKTVEKKFKRSALHIHEVMENVCNRMNGYGLLISAAPGKTDKAREYHFVKDTTEDGQASTFVDKSQEVKKKLQHKCDDILEEYEEWLEEYFAKEVTAADADRELCLMRAGYCKMEDLIHSMYPPPIPVPEKKEEPAPEGDALKTDENAEL